MADEHAGTANAPEATPGTAGKPSRVDAYHEQFAARMIAALKQERAPWQKPWAPGERMSQRNFTTDKDYRGSNAMFLAVAGDAKGYTDPRWGGYRQIAEAGGHVRKGEKGTPIMYVEYKSREVDKDATGKPRLNEDGHKQYHVTQRDRPMVRIHTVFNVAQTDGLKLPPLVNKEAPVWEANKRVEGLVEHAPEDMNVPTIDHQQGDRAYYNKGQDRVVLPDKGQFHSETGYSHTALHEIAHATGHESRLNRSTLTNHGGVGSETYAREELRAEMGAMMAGEQLGVGHEPRHGTSYVQSWIKALENDPKEIRLAAVDAQRAADWMVERARSIERTRPVEQEQQKETTTRELLPGETPNYPVPVPLPPSAADRETGKEAERDIGPSR